MKTCQLCHAEIGWLSRSYKVTIRLGLGEDEFTVCRNCYLKHTQAEEKIRRPARTEARQQVRSVGSCSACGRQVSAIPMSEVVQLMASGGEAAIRAKATRCPKCSKLYCTGCVHGAGRKCPNCRVDVEEFY